MQTFNISFLVRPSKANKLGEAPIEISLIINGVRSYINTGRRCKPSQFDCNRQLMRRDKDTNEYLNLCKEKILMCQTQLIKDGIDVTTENIKKLYLDDNLNTKPTLFKQYDEYIITVATKASQNQISDTTLLKHRVTYSNLKEYIKAAYNDDDITLDKINYSFVDGFFNHLRGSKSHNTALKDVGRLKQVILLCFNNGIIPNNPFANWKQSKEHIDVEYLTEDEINLIETKEFTSTRLNQVRDVFIFACYTALAYSDLKSLTNDNFKVDKDGNEWIYKNRTKTNVLSKIPLLPKAKAILERYDYKLPVLSNQKYNCYLDEIGNICEIRKKLHTHLARHSAATMFLNYGVPIEVVSKILGHTNTTQTQHYAKLLDNSIMDAMKNTKLFNK